MPTLCIYGLTDPRTGEVRYVGKSVDPDRRLAQHLRDARRGEDSYKARWIRQLLDASRRPVAVILCPTTAEAWEDDERRVIREMREAGARLTNVTAGGEGVDKPHTAEQHEKIAAAHRGKVVSGEQRQKIRAALIALHTTCKRGHAWTQANTRIMFKEGRPYRACRLCINANQSRRYTDKGLRKGRTKQTCRQGHSLTGDNLRLMHRPGGRVERICRECTRARNQRAKKGMAK